MVLAQPCQRFRGLGRKHVMVRCLRSAALWLSRALPRCAWCVRGALACTVARERGSAALGQVLGGACFFVGALLQTFAANLGMLFVGRLILGGGIGFANQVGSGFYGLVRV